VAGANDTITLTVPTLTFTAKDGVTRKDVHLAVYRNTPTSTALYYRVSPLDPSDAQWVENDPTANSVDFIDYMADTVAETKELDYQNSTELENLPCKTPSILLAGKERLFAAGGEIPEDEVWHSKLPSGINAAEFNDALLITVDRRGGVVTGLAILNDALVIFKEDSIYVAPGEGPDNIGQGFWGETQRVVSDVGCIAQRSIVETPMGLMFQSDKGIFLLDQKYDVHYIGAEVEDYNFPHRFWLHPNV
jgi:hypothetical protein